MSIAISLKVNDGIVLAADSASIYMTKDPSGLPVIVNTYNNVSKIFNLYRGLPVGAITWGTGSIGQSSISTLAKDFRKLISEDKKWKINPEKYTIKSVAEKFKKFIFEDNYVKAFENWKEKPEVGFMVAGYSAGVSLSEEWIINIKNGECKEFKLIRKKEETGVTWNGLVEPIFRLIFGFSPDLTEILKEAELDDKIIKKIINLCQKKLTATMVIPSMPIQDAIDLAAFLVETTINFSKFTPGLTAVGGPIEIAVITRHEGFKWIKRKYYFDVNLNPKEE